MVWWIDNYRSSVCNRRFFHYGTSTDILKDRIFRTTNIMFNLDNGDYDAHDIHFLTSSGVNMFNVDRTIYGEDFFKKMKETITASENVHEMYPKIYISPIGLAITMSIKARVDIDDRVNIIILKDLNNLEDLLQFKKQNRNKSVLVIIWIKKMNIIDRSQIIKFSDGIVVDDSGMEENCLIINLCKQAFKPVFYILEGVIKDYRTIPVDERKIYAIASEIVTYKFDGVIIFDNNEEEKGEKRRELIRSLVTAIDVVENTTNNNTELYKFSLQIKIPILPPKSTALAACIAAKHSGASAIIVLTSTGLSARLVANTAPPCHILAITSRKETARLLHLYRKVIPLFYHHSNTSWQVDCWNRIQFGTTVALQTGLCLYEAKVVVLAPSNQDIGYCNSLRIASMPLKCEDLAF